MYARSATSYIILSMTQEAGSGFSRSGGWLPLKKKRAKKIEFTRKNTVKYKVEESGWQTRHVRCVSANNKIKSTRDGESGLKK